MKTQPGLNIKKIRQEKGISLERLSETVKVDLSYLQKIESQELEPFISDLLKIANALGTDISALIFGKEISQKKALVTRAKSRIRIDRKGGYDYESLAPQYSGRHMEPFMVEVHEQDPASGEYSSHAGEEFHYVLEGRLRVIVDKDAFVLDKGDSLYFDSSLPHALFALDGPARIIAMVYNRESMLHLTTSRCMRDLIQAAKHLGGLNMAVVCPGKTEVEAVNKAIEEGIIKTAYLIGDKSLIPQEALLFLKHYVFIESESADESYFQGASQKGVEFVRDGLCQMIMKGQMNTAVFVRAVLDKKIGISTGRRLSLVSLFELPGIDRLIFLTDPGINPALVSGNDLHSSVDIIKNAIDVANSLGIVRPKVALLEANEVPSANIPATLYEKQLTEMQWNDADVFGPLSYDLALYEEATEKKNLENNPVAGKADILVVPYISSGNFLYKAWAMTMNAEVANVVLGARAPLIITSRSDTNTTKFLTICVCAVYSQYLLSKDTAAS